MANDLSTLNKILFETLKGVQDDTIDGKKAQTIVNIGNSIVNNAKIQLQAFKATGGRTKIGLLGASEEDEESVDPKPSRMVIPMELSEPTKKKILTNKKGQSRLDLALEFAKEEGYKNVAEAIAAMGKVPFNKGLDNYMQDDKVA